MRVKIKILSEVTDGSLNVLLLTCQSETLSLVFEFHNMVKMVCNGLLLLN